MTCPGDVLAALVALARHHHDVALARGRDGQADGRGPVRLDDQPAALPGGTVSTPCSISARMASGSSERGLSLVRMARSARPTAAAPISGRLARSRSPPQPSTMDSRPWVTGRSARSTASTAPGLCE